MNDRSKASVTLHPSGVVAPALNSMRIAAEVVRLGQATLELVDEEPKAEQGMTFDFGHNATPADERIKKRADWLVERGIAELARGLRLSLEEAHLYLSVFSLVGKEATFGEFQKVVAEARGWANKVNFPDLMAAVNGKLKEPLVFSREMASLQRVRNCLEHRKGIVGKQDVDDGSDAFTLFFPRIRIFTVVDGKEVQLRRGLRLEAGQVVAVQNQLHERKFKLGQQITLDIEEYQELAFAMNFFANDLQLKLPTVVAPK